MHESFHFFPFFPLLKKTTKQTKQKAIQSKVENSFLVGKNKTLQDYWTETGRIILADERCKKTFKKRIDGTNIGCPV